MPPNNIQSLVDAGFDVPDNLSAQEVDFINGLTQGEINTVIDIAKKASAALDVKLAIRKYQPVRVCFPF